MKILKWVVNTILIWLFFVLILPCYGFGKGVILIADIHHRPYVQRSIVGYLDRFSRNAVIRTVLCEGATGQANFSFLSGRRAAKKLLSIGFLSGAEFWGYLHRKQVKLLGIEDKKLYLKQLELKESIESRRDKIFSALSRLGLDQVNFVRAAVNLKLTPYETVYFLSSPLFEQLACLKQVRNFYELARLRDKVFALKIKCVLDKIHSGYVVVIIGGYHVQAVASRLKLLGINVRVVYPVRKLRGDVGLYELTTNYVIPKPLICFKLGQNARKLALDIIHEKKFLAFALPVDCRRDWIERVKQALPKLSKDMLKTLFIKGPGFVSKGHVFLLDDYLRGRISSDDISILWQQLSIVLKKRANIIVPLSKLQALVHFHEYLHVEFHSNNVAINKVLSRYYAKLNDILTRDDFENFKMIYGELDNRLILEEIVISFIQWQHFLDKGDFFLSDWLSKEKIKRILPLLNSCCEEILFLLSVGDNPYSYSRNRLRYALNIAKAVSRASSNLPKEMSLEKSAYFFIMAVRFSFLGAGLSHYDLLNYKRLHLSYYPELGKDQRMQFFHLLKKVKRVVFKVKGGEGAIIYSLLGIKSLLSIRPDLKISLDIEPKEPLHLDKSMVWECLKEIGLADKKLRITINQRNKVKPSKDSCLICIGCTQKNAQVSVTKSHLVKSKVDFRVNVMVKKAREITNPSMIGLPLEELLNLKNEIFPLYPIPTWEDSDRDAIVDILQKIDISSVVLTQYSGQTIFDLLRPSKIFNFEKAKQLDMSNISNGILILTTRSSNDVMFKLALWMDFVKHFGVLKTLKLWDKVKVLEIPDKFAPVGKDLIWPDQLWKGWVLAFYYRRFLNWQRERNKFVKTAGKDKAFLPDLRARFGLNSFKTEQEKKSYYDNRFSNSNSISYNKMVSKMARYTKALCVNKDFYGSRVYRLGIYRVYQLRDLPDKEVEEVLKYLGVGFEDFYSSYLQLTSDNKKRYVLNAIVVPNFVEELSKDELLEIKTELERCGISWPKEIDLSKIFVKEDDKLVCLRPDLLFPFIYVAKNDNLSHFTRKFLDKWDKFMIIPLDIIRRVRIESKFTSLGLDWQSIKHKVPFDKLEQIITQVYKAEYVNSFKDKKDLLRFCERHYPISIQLQLFNNDWVKLEVFWDKKTNRIFVGNNDMTTFKIDQAKKVSSIFLDRFEQWFVPSRLTALFLYWQQLHTIGNGKVFYPASGADIFSPMMIFDPDELVMMDRIPWGDVDQKELGEKEFKNYMLFSQKRRGFLLGDYLRDMGELGKYICLELKYLLGVKHLRINRVGKDEMEVSFIWRHPISGRKTYRKIIFISCSKDISAVYSAIKDFAPVGVLYTKASEGFWKDLSKQETLKLLDSTLSLNSVIVSDTKYSFNVFLNEGQLFSKELYKLCRDFQVSLGYQPSHPGYIFTLYPKGFVTVVDSMKKIWPYIKLKWGIKEGSVWLETTWKGHRYFWSATYEEWNDSYKLILKKIFSAFVPKKYVVSHYSKFYRNKFAYNKFKSDILPEILKKKKNGQKTIKIALVGSSYGDELASFMFILEPFLRKDPDLRVEFFSIDISKEMLEKAKSNIFSQREKEEDRTLYIPDKKLWLKRAKFEFICADIENSGWRDVLKDLFFPTGVDVVTFNFVDMWLPDRPKPAIYNWLISLVKPYGALMTDAPVLVPQNWEILGPFPYISPGNIDALWYIRQE